MTDTDDGKIYNLKPYHKWPAELRQQRESSAWAYQRHPIICVCNSNSRRSVVNVTTHPHIGGTHRPKHLDGKKESVLPVMDPDNEDDPPAIDSIAPLYLERKSENAERPKWLNKSVAVLPTTKSFDSTLFTEYRGSQGGFRLDEESRSRLKSAVDETKEKLAPRRAPMPAPMPPKTTQHKDTIEKIRRASAPDVSLQGLGDEFAELGISRGVTGIDHGGDKYAGWEWSGQDTEKSSALDESLQKLTNEVAQLDISKGVKSKSKTPKQSRSGRDIAKVSYQAAPGKRKPAEPGTGKGARKTANRRKREMEEQQRREQQQREKQEQPQRSSRSSSGVDRSW